MSFEFTVRGHAVDPHNPAVKAAFDKAVIDLRKQFDTAGTVNGEGYSTDPSGTLEFNSSQTVDALAIVQAQEAANAVDLATAEAAAAQAEAELKIATENKAAADKALASAKKEESTETPSKEAAEDKQAKVAKAQADLAAAKAETPVDEAKVDAAEQALADANALP